MVLTLEQRATNDETWSHINMVRCLITGIVEALLERSNSHDSSKLSLPEVEGFTEYTPMLKDLTYGSDEYKNTLDKMMPFLEHHYAHNRHHPEHHDNGVCDMDLVDLVEMLCDWKAATLRHDDGDILKSLDINATRFGISDQLCSIFRNTVDRYLKVPGENRCF